MVIGKFDIYIWMIEQHFDNWDAAAPKGKMESRVTFWNFDIPKTSRLFDRPTIILCIHISTIAN